jgi:four helix bundle protein
MSNKMSNDKNKYDLEERTAKFGETVIDFAKMIPRNEITQRIIPQLIGAGTSVGANYCEADCAESSKDFIHKMAIANKEIKESKHFIRMAAKACPELASKARFIWKEARELNLIFISIINNTKKKIE